MGRLRGRGSRTGSGVAYLIGGILLLAMIALLFVIALILGGLALTGYGIYIGIVARQRDLLRDPKSQGGLPLNPRLGQKPSTPSSAPAVVGPTVFGPEASYGLSAACVVVGLVMFIAGIALLGGANDSPNQTASTIGGSKLATRLPTVPPSPTINRAPNFAAPVLPPSQFQMTTTAQQVAPAMPTQRVEMPNYQTNLGPRLDNDNSSGDDTVYYKNCDAARAAGAAPIKRGEPGYRPGLDRDKDGTACDK